MVETFWKRRETKPLKEKTKLNQRHLEKWAFPNLKNLPLT